ncbi:hypothetical protein MKX01_022162 [Papaver californicum]|nr:hypothetical protein MKX01_022162 [Papaver californicum]
MATLRLLSLLIIVLAAVDTINAQGLKLGFYKKTCPSSRPSFLKLRLHNLPALLLRMHFHDCFVKVLGGFNVIDAIKAAVEKEYPGIVSCADIIALIKGPFWNVPTGRRRNGRVSTNADAFANLPPPFLNITALKASFASKGLSSKDLVVLSGAHTIGVSQCQSFSNRLYNFTGKGDTDPSFDSEYVPRLKSKCKPNDSVTIAEMDPGSFRTFDSSYYSLVSKRRGLFEFDAALLNDPVTKAYITVQATTKGPAFFKDFAMSMEKMGTVEILTGSAGEIRKHCAFVN